jgi:hypothetical protein
MSLIIFGGCIPDHDLDPPADDDNLDYWDMRDPDDAHDDTD